MPAVRIGIMGAGAVGCFVGGKLVPHASHVIFVGRRGFSGPAGPAAAITLEGLDEPTVRIEEVDFQTDPAALAGADVVLCAVKSAQTAGVGTTLAGIVREDALVVSLQNGVRNADVLRTTMPRHEVLGGIVELNVVAEPNGVFRRGTTGGLVLEASAHPRLAELTRVIEASGLPLEVSRDLRAQQWSKLVINLSNALGALSGAPTRTVLFDAGYRRILRAVIVEALAVLRAGQITTARLGRLPIGLFPPLLALPTPIFAALARAQLRVDPAARSSMWQDLARGRPTEIDELNGEIVRVAQAHGAPAPLNERLVALVHEAEGHGSPNLGVAALRARLGLG